jgi:hypothetical protein
MKSTTYGFLYSGATYTTFEFPGSVQTEVTAVSSQGTVVAGVYALPGFQYAFVYRPTAKTHYKEITGGALGDYYGLQPQTVNNSGYVTGSYFSVDRNQNRSFTTVGGTVALDFNPTVSGSSACGINGANPPGTVLVGYCYAPVKGMVSLGGSVMTQSAPGATLTVLGAVNVKNVAAGTAVIGGTTYIFSADQALNYTLVAAPATWNTISTVGINAAGKIVGRFTDVDSKIKVFWAH